MSDTFWVSFFTLCTLIAKGIIDEWRARRVISQGRAIAEDLHANTVATIKGTANAEKAAMHAAAKTEAIEKKTDAIDEKLNGGPGGLQDRIAKLEEGFAIHQNGILAMSRSLDQMIMQVADLTKAFRNNSQPPADVQGSNEP